MNQRALIDKVLARYSGEFTGASHILHGSRRSEHQRVVFRELLQNSDDASSKAVEIRFETKRYIERSSSSEDPVPPRRGVHLPDLKTVSVCSFRLPSRFVGLIGRQVHRWTFKNNGIIFRDRDWSRLKRIGTDGPSVEFVHS